MRFAVIGNGKMAIDALRCLVRTPGAVPVLAVGDPSQETTFSRLQKTCERENVAYLPAQKLTEPVVAALQAADLDYIVSANNFMIFKGAVLQACRRGIVNFHNGPLPRYGGLNSCSWALFNGEQEHGVTWHLVDGGIDSGPILRQRRFAITAEDTAVGLMSRCILEGIALLNELAADLIAGKNAATPQDLTQRLYYGLRDRPFAGDLPWWEGSAALAALQRALSFAPMANLFYRPRLLKADGTTWFAETLILDTESPAAKPGTLLVSLDGALRVACNGCSVTLSDLRHADGNRVAANDIASAVGEQLRDPRKGNI